MTALTAWRRPRWASAMTRCTPASPRAFRLRKKAVQKAPSSLSPTANPSTSRRPAPHTPAATPRAPAHGLGGPPAVAPGLAVGGVHEDGGEPLAGQGSVPEGADLGIQVSADPADLALADPAVGAQRPDQVVDLAGAHPMQIGLHHHREQRL